MPNFNYLDKRASEYGHGSLISSFESGYSGTRHAVCRVGFRCKGNSGSHR